MPPSPVHHVAQLLAAITDPHAITTILDELFDLLAPIVMQALIVELTKLLERYLEANDYK